MRDPPSPFAASTPYPTSHPTMRSTPRPTTNPSIPPTRRPTNIPSFSPTKPPSKSPTKSPTSNPSNTPTNVPTNFPTQPPTITPEPSKSPTDSPSTRPTRSPSMRPTQPPTSTSFVNAGTDRPNLLTTTDSGIPALKSQSVSSPDSSLYWVLIASGILVIIGSIICCFGIFIYYTSRQRRLVDEIRITMDKQKNYGSVAIPMQGIPSVRSVASTESHSQLTNVSQSTKSKISNKSQSSIPSSVSKDGISPNALTIPQKGLPLETSFVFI